MLAGHIAKSGETRNDYRIFVGKKYFDNVQSEGRDEAGNKTKLDVWMTVCEKQKRRPMHGSSLGSCQVATSDFRGMESSGPVTRELVLYSECLAGNIKSKDGRD
jgi:hypothetical protein